MMYNEVFDPKGPNVFLMSQPRSRVGSVSFGTVLRANGNDDIIEPCFAWEDKTSL